MVHVNYVVIMFTATGTNDRTVGNQRHLISIRITVTPVEDGGPLRDVEFAKTIDADEQMLDGVRQGVLQACSRGSCQSNVTCQLIMACAMYRSTALLSCDQCKNHCREIIVCTRQLTSNGTKLCSRMYS